MKKLPKNRDGEPARRVPGSAQPAAEKAPSPGAVKPAIPRARAWLMRLALAAGAPLLVLLCLELVLRVAGFGYPTAFLIRSPSGTEYATNPKFGVRYFGPETVLRPVLFSIPERKAADTIRICVLGESAAMGTPDPAFAFCRILEAHLRHRHPGKRFEFMNAAMRGINSYVIRTIAAECAQHEVDVYLIYAGNNEMAGFHSAGPDTPALALWLPVLRAADWLRATRIGQLVLRVAASGKTAALQDMASFRGHALRSGDWRRDRMKGNFDANLHGILRAATGAGAQVLLCTVPVNLADCPPLVSLHRAGLPDPQRARWAVLAKQGADWEQSRSFSEAVRVYAEALRIDDEYAELHFRLGRCYRECGNPGAALRHFSLARDWDALQFRTDSDLNRVIRAAATQAGGAVVLVDVEKAFNESPLSPGGVPGETLFHDHVHPTFAGNYVIATNCLFHLESLLQARLGAAAPAELLTEKQCAAALGYTLYHELNILAAMARLKSAAPFLDQLDHAVRQPAEEADIKKRLAAFTAEQAAACVRACHAALEGNPDDWTLRFNLASVCLELGRIPDARQQFQSLVTQFPQVAKFRLLLAAALVKSGDRSGAAAQLAEAARCDPDDKQVREARAALEPGKGP